MPAPSQYRRDGSTPQKAIRISCQISPRRLGEVTIPIALAGLSGWYCRRFITRWTELRREVRAPVSVMDSQPCSPNRGRACPAPRVAFEWPMAYGNSMTDDPSRTDLPASSPAVAPGTSAAEVLTSGVVDELTTTAPTTSPPTAPPVRQRRVWLPVILLLLTCLSTFWVGANQWFPLGFSILSDDNPGITQRQMVLYHWDDGLIYMACVLGILLTHEMGHFLATVWYRIPASFPYVIPMPFMPLGTFGAVIGMDGRRADRKEIFDIGLAGPLAGLVVAVPVMIWGIRTLDLSQPRFGPMEFHSPLLMELLMRYFQPTGYRPGITVAMSQLNPYFMAGWVGLLVTGLNMLPVSQLDGGHVIYTLFGKRSWWIARGFVLLAFGYFTYAFIYGLEMSWILMLGLILLIGIDHPPTRDDSVKLGWFRFILGLASLAIPVLCFAPQAISASR